MAAIAPSLGLPGGLGPPPTPQPPPVSGRDYLLKLRKYLGANLTRLAPPPRGKTKDASWLAQSYTVLTLGLDPNSAPLSPSVKVPLTLGFGSPAQPPRHRPVLLRLPPDKLLYLLLRWQSLPQSLSHVGHTDVPVPDGVVPVARGRGDQPRREDGDVESVRSWVGSIRSVSMGTRTADGGGFGWWSKPKEVDEDKILLELYSVFNTLPGLLIHPPFHSEAPVAELLDAGGYTQFGGVDVRVPLDVLRNLQILELEGFDPRGLLIPVNPLLHSLTVRDVEDADDWLPELVIEGEIPSPPAESPVVTPEAASSRFPNLRHLSLTHTSMLSFPALPLTSLTHLDLSNNLLNAIPESLAALHNLVSLNLSSNLITSVRNAPAALGNVHTINLARNRIDCLVGLDRVLGLRRVDVRGNLLAEADEVGRLAVLPVVEAVWSADNTFSLTHMSDGSVAAKPAEEWRTEIGAAFAAEAHTVVLDDVPLSWSEQRRIDALLAARGRPAAANVYDTAAPAPPPRPTSPVSPSSPTRGGFNRTHLAARSATATASPTRASKAAAAATAAAVVDDDHFHAIATASALVPTPVGRQLAPPSPSRSPAPKKAAAKKRPRRRVVNLDDENGSSSSPAAKA